MCVPLTSSIFIVLLPYCLQHDCYHNPILHRFTSKPTQIAIFSDGEYATTSLVPTINHLEIERLIATLSSSTDDSLITKWGISEDLRPFPALNNGSYCVEVRRTSPSCIIRVRSSRIALCSIIFPSLPILCICTA